MTELEQAYEELMKAQKWLLTVEAGMKLKTEQLRKAQQDYSTASLKYAKAKQSNEKEDKV